MHVDLSHDEAAALVRKLQAIVENDRYPLSRRIRTLRGIFAKFLPEPVHEPMPPTKVDERRRTTAATRRREFNDHSRNAQAVTADHQMVDRQLGWDAPSDQLRALRAAVKDLRSVSARPRERFDHVIRDEHQFGGCRRRRVLVRALG